MNKERKKEREHNDGCRKRQEGTSKREIREQKKAPNELAALHEQPSWRHRCRLMWGSLTHSHCYFFRTKWWSLCTAVMYYRTTNLRCSRTWSFTLHESLLHHFPSSLPLFSFPNINSSWILTFYLGPIFVHNETLTRTMAHATAQ